MTSRYWSFAVLVLVATAFEFFDFFIIGFIISIIAPEWELTFGATATVLYAGGVGAIVGSFVGDGGAIALGAGYCSSPGSLLPRLVRERLLYPP